MDGDNPVTVADRPDGVATVTQPVLVERWTFLGGWFGLPPSTALTTSDGAGLRHDPVYVFVPPFAVAYARDFVVRLARHSARGWDNEAIPDDVSEASELLGVSFDAALKLIREIDD